MLGIVRHIHALFADALYINHMHRTRREYFNNRSSYSRRDDHTSLEILICQMKDASIKPCFFVVEQTAPRESATEGYLHQIRLVLDRRIGNILMNGLLRRQIQIWRLEIADSAPMPCILTCP
jgi:hypothetical protein